MSARKTTLKNGLRIITIPQKGTRAVTVLVLVGTGSKYETKDKSGISHFLEHMFFKGTEKRPTPMAVAEELDQVGGLYNAFTGEDYTGYYAKVDAAHFDLALDWVADIFLHSKLPSREIQKEKGVVQEELHMYRDTPGRHIDDLWMRLLYGDQPAGWNIVGSRESILGFSRNDLREYIAHQYVASNTIVCIAGNVKQEEAERKARKAFERIRVKKPTAKVPVKDAQSAPQLLLEWRKTNQTNIALGVRAYSDTHPMRFAQHLLAIALGGMMSSRLFVEVREKLGLTYDISTLSESGPDTGYVVTTAGIKNGSVEKAIQVILKEYRKLKNAGISKSELEKAKEYEKGKMVLHLESSSAKANFYGMQELLRGEMLTPEKIYGKIDQVTPLEIRTVARDIFRPEKLNLAVLGPYRNKAKFSNLLRI
ncbi:MAG TPA: pitrilysin family protein [Candidatus Paceibacterota bacterium]